MSFSEFKPAIHCFTSKSKSSITVFIIYMLSQIIIERLCVQVQILSKVTFIKALTIGRTENAFASNTNEN